jgi:hypothetical protein
VKIEKKMDSTSKNETPEHYQNVIVMRHGDRIDNFDPLWIATAPRPWDPPLVKEGRVRAFSTGRKFRNLFGYPLHRVFVSPFLRCIQTAAEAVIALSAVHDNPDALTGHSVTIDPSKLKVYSNYLPFLYYYNIECLIRIIWIFNLYNKVLLIRGA